MTADQSQAIGRFFDSLRGEYTEAIERCFPRYREMLWAVLDYLPRDRSYPTILELGCGTGNLTQLLMEAYPQAAIQAVDVSGESLAVCHSRLAHSGRLTCRQVDFRQLELPASSLPLVVSSIAIHHLTSAEKRQLFRQVYDWLVPGGVFCFADQCAGATDDLYVRHIENWKSLSLAAGSTTAQWDMWMQHQSAHDHHDTLGAQMAWLGEVGFTTVDCPWRYLLWAIVQARKA